MENLIQKLPFLTNFNNTQITLCWSVSSLGDEKLDVLRKYPPINLATANTLRQRGFFFKIDEYHAMFPDEKAPITLEKFTKVTKKALTQSLDRKNQIDILESFKVPRTTNFDFVGQLQSEINVFYPVRNN